MRIMKKKTRLDKEHGVLEMLPPAQSPRPEAAGREVREKGVPQRQSRLQGPLLQVTQAGDAEHRIGAGEKNQVRGKL